MKNRIVIVVDGGVVQDFYMDDKTLSVLVVDIDNLKDGDTLYSDGFADLIPKSIIEEYGTDTALTFKMLSRDDYDKINGTCGRGVVLTTYQELVKLFGAPEYYTGSDKTQVEWDIEWSDGTLSTIYDWKCYGEEPEEITEWSIGGNSPLSLDYVRKLLNK
jgi:hypothetical protein